MTKPLMKKPGRLRISAEFRKGAARAKKALAAERRASRRRFLAVLGIR